MELRYKAGPRDRQNLFTVTGFCHIKVLFRIFYYHVHYTKDFVIYILVISRFHCNVDTWGTVENLCTDRVSMFKSKVHLHLEQHTGHLQLTQSRFSVVYASRHKFTSRLFVLNLIKNCLLQILPTKVTYKGYLFTHENTLTLYTQCNHLQCHENALAADNFASHSFS